MHPRPTSRRSNARLCRDRRGIADSGAGRSPGNPQPDVVITPGTPQTATGGRPALLPRAVPRPAPQNMVGPRRRARRVTRGRVLVVIRGEAVLTPLLNVAVHIEQPKGVRRERPYGHRPLQLLAPLAIAIGPAPVEAGHVGGKRVQVVLADLERRTVLG